MWLVVVWRPRSCTSHAYPCALRCCSTIASLSNIDARRTRPGAGGSPLTLRKDPSANWHMYNPCARNAHVHRRMCPVAPLGRDQKNSPSASCRKPLCVERGLWCDVSTITRAIYLSWFKKYSAGYVLFSPEMS